MLVLAADGGLGGPMEQTRLLSIPSCLGLCSHLQLEEPALVYLRGRPTLQGVRASLLPLPAKLSS